MWTIQVGPNARRPGSNARSKASSVRLPAFAWQASLLKPRFFFVDEPRALIGAEGRNTVLLDVVLQDQQPAQLLSFWIVAVLANIVVFLDE